MGLIDREDFVEKVSSFIQNVNQPSIILVAADSGIGKHSAVLKLFDEKWIDDYKTISMLSYAANEDTSILKNKYFFKIIELVQNNYKPFDEAKNKLSFEQFIKQNKQIQRKISKSIATTTLSDFTTNEITKSGLIMFCIQYLRNRLKLADISYYKNLLSEETIHSANLGKEYLNYILCNDKIILDLRATQYMDQETITNLCGALKKVKKKTKSVIIMEYDTDCTDSPANYTLFRTMLQNAIGTQNVYSYDLKPLDLNNFIDAISMQINQDMKVYTPWIKKEYLELGIKSISAAINEFYRAEKLGELMVSSIPTVEYSDYFNKIGSAGLCILSILDIHGGRISKQLLKELYAHTDITLNEGYLQERIELMITQHFIMDDMNDICFLNRAVKDVWEKYLKSTTNKSPGILVAATKCYDHYENIVKNEADTKISAQIKEPILILLRIIEFYIPNRIINLTSYIQMIAQNFTSPEKAWKPISLLLHELSQYSKDYLDTYYNIIDLCCDLELYKEALQIWYDIQDIAFDPEKLECNRANFLYCKVHYLADKHSEVIYFTTKMLKCNIKPISKLYYSIYLIITYRAINQYDKITPIVEYIDSQKDIFNNLPQYGLFLRISETYKSRMDAIPDVEKSVQFFQNHDIELQAAKSQVSLSFLYTITGDLSKGAKALMAAKNVLKHSYQHITCNNEAAIRLFQSKFDNTTETLLTNAIMCSNGIFSNLVIYNNLMILYYETHNFTNLKLRLNTVKEMMNSLIDKHLIAVMAYNLSVFLKSIDEKESKKYYKIAFENCDHDSALKTRLYKHEPHNDCEKFVLKKPWHVTMLSFWETDFMID